MLLAIFVVPRLAPNVPLSEFEITKSAAGGEQKKLDPVREIIGYATFIVVLLGLIFTKKIGIPQWQIALTGAVVIAFSGILTPKEMVSSMNISMLLLFISSLGIGTALSETGLAAVIGDKLSTMIYAVNNNYIAGLLLFLIPFVLTQIMMNNAVMAIFKPLYAMLCASMGINPIGVMMIVTVAPMTSFLSPMATTAMPLAMSLGHYNQKDVLKMGVLPGLAVMALTVFMAMTLYPIY